VPSTFNGPRKFALVFRTNTSSFFGPDFAQTRNKMTQGLLILKIDFRYVFFTKIAIHSFCFAKEIRSTKSEILNYMSYILNLEFVSNFDIRISNLIIAGYL